MIKQKELGEPVGIYLSDVFQVFLINSARCPYCDLSAHFAGCDDIVIYQYPPIRPSTKKGTHGVKEHKRHYSTGIVSTVKKHKRSEDQPTEAMVTKLEC